MNSRRALFVAACLFPLAAIAIATVPAAAQVQPQQTPAASPWDQQPQQSPWPQAGQGPQGLQGLQGVQQPQQQQQGPSPVQAQCMQEFGKLREAAEKRALAIRSASERKAPAKEACGLFNAFSDAEVKMIKYATENTARCGIPPEIVKNMRAGHAKATEIRTKVCQAAAAGPGPAPGPTLSDALSAPVPDASNIKTGRGTGTYDTLSGTPLVK
jgi:hypothetical protein